MANLSTLQDSLKSTTLNTGVWTFTSGAAASTNGAILSPPTGVSAVLASLGPYNLDSVSANVALLRSGHGDDITMSVRDSGGAWTFNVVNIDGMLDTSLQVAGSPRNTFLGYTNLDTWWKLQLSGMNLLFSTSIDGINWTQRSTTSLSGLTTTSVQLLFSAVVTDNYTGQVAAVRNVNVTPTAPAPSGGTTTSGTTTSGGTASTLPSLPFDNTKRYLYKVYKSDGTFVGVLKDVISEPTWSQPINSAAATMTVQLARSADNTLTLLDNLFTASGQQIVDQTGDPYVVKSTVNNTVGPGSDVDLNYFVDVYVTYGGFDYLTTLSGEQIVDQNGDPYIVSVGAPNGRRIFSGFILDDSLIYDNENGAGVEFTLVSNGYELSQAVIKVTGTETTTVDLTSTPTEAATVAKTTILATNPTYKMTSATSSVPTTGVSIRPLFRLNTKEEGLQQVVDLLGSNYYWFGNPADNNVYLKPVGVTADHTFVFGKHLNSIRLTRTMEQLANNLYFVGGDPGTGQIYKQYTSPDGSLTTWRRGLARHTDQQYLSTTNTDAYAASLFSKFSQPIYTTTVEISAATYDIENIQLGQMVRFRGSSNATINGLLLQIVELDYSPYKVKLQLGQLLDSQSQIVTDVEALASTNAQTAIPNTPS